MEPSGRHLIDNLRRPRSEADKIAILRHQGLANAGRFGEFDVAQQMARLAMHGDDGPGVEPAIEKLRLILARMAGCVDERII